MKDDEIGYYECESCKERSVIFGKEIRIFRDSFPKETPCGVKGCSGKKTLRQVQ